jgi:hypothetical protein
MYRIFRNGRAEGVWCAKSVLGPPWTIRSRAWCLQLPGLEVWMASTRFHVLEEEEDVDRRINWYGKDKGTNQAGTGGWDADAEQFTKDVVLSPVSNRVSPSPVTLKSSCASANNIGLIDGTAELTMEVRCDDRTQQDLIGMLTEPT